MIVGIHFLPACKAFGVLSLGDVLEAPYVPMNVRSALRATLTPTNLDRQRYG